MPAKNTPTQDPNGGLTAAGRKAFHDKDGSHLKPGVRGAADTPEKMKRKCSFLRRHYANPSGPLVDGDGKPTRLALQARAWGEAAPKTPAAAKKLAEKGSRLLERYKKAKSKYSFEPIVRLNIAATKKAKSKKAPAKPKKDSRCWPGCEPTPGKKPGSKGSCKPKD